MAKTLKRRSYPRLAITFLAHCLSDELTCWTALVINLSRGGARFVFRSHSDPPNLVLIKIHNRSGNTLQRPIREVHVDSAGDYRLVRCAFEIPLTTEEFLLLVRTQF